VLRYAKDITVILAPETFFDSLRTLQKFGDRDMYTIPTRGNVVIDLLHYYSIFWLIS
jgi:hypothetical protein